MVAKANESSAGALGERSPSPPLFSLVLASILTITIGGFAMASVIEFL